MINSKVYDISDKTIINYNNLLPNILVSRNKDNQAMTFGQLKKYSVINIFLQNSCKNVIGEDFLKKLYMR